MNLVGILYKRVSNLELLFARRVGEGGVTDKPLYVGLYILSQLVDVIPNIGLYRDDGLAVSHGTCRQIENMKKNICKTFQNLGLSITIEANSKIVNFLDINLNLASGIYKPYMKENDNPLYVDSKSNHPPTVLKSIPLGVNRRLSRISANKKVFDTAVPPYQRALQSSGFSHVLEYEPVAQCSTQKKKRKRNVTWFNPPYSNSVKSNIGRDFLQLLDTAFPPSNPLNKLFSRQTVKISYKCMPNMAQSVSRHNATVLKGDQPQPAAPPVRSCNCKDGPATCPAQAKCLTDSVVYKATVTETVSGMKEIYTGMTANRFKDRWYGHNSDMNNPGNKGTRLSAHIWELKDKGTDYDVEWDFIDRAPSFNPITRKCRLCLKEKFHIMYSKEGSTLNKRQEIFNTCRHRKQKLLQYVKT